jgi:hypothetical protein
MSAAIAVTSQLDRIAELRHRVEVLRSEIAAAENKIPRMHAAIEIRRQTLSRLEARLVLEDGSHPARTGDE